MTTDKFRAGETMNFGREIWIKRRGRNRKENKTSEIRSTVRRVLL
jgi:hypothetical protein